MTIEDLQAQLAAEIEAHKRTTIERDIALAEVKSLQDQIVALGRDLAHLKKAVYGALYGRSSERNFAGQGLLPFTPDLDGKAIQAPETPIPSPAAGVDGSHRAAPRKHPGRNPIPEHLPRVERPHQKSTEELDQTFGAGNWKVIDVETREELDYRPGSLFVVEHKITKYGAKSGTHAPVRAEAPKPVIAKGRPGAGLLAHIITSKYELHLTLYRLEKLFKRQGVTITSSTMCAWLAESALLLDGIVRALRAEILASGIVRIDDTPVTLLDPDAPKGSRESFMWPFMSHEGQIIFRWTKGRSRDGPLAILGDFKGYLQGDAAPLNTSLCLDGIIFVACWAHARRGFFKAQDDFPKESAHALALIRLLYAVEADAKARSLDPEAVRALRGEKSRPILAEIRAWAEMAQRSTLPSSKLGGAIDYMLSHFDGLERYLEDGRLQIDNNDVEREIRSIAVGRKNWLFFAGERGGEAAAVFYTLVANCRFEKIDPFEYFRDVLARSPNLKGADAASLTPRRWKADRARIAADALRATPAHAISAN